MLLDPTFKVLSYRPMFLIYFLMLLVKVVFRNGQLIRRIQK